MPLRLLLLALLLNVAAAVLPPLPALAGEMTGRVSYVFDGDTLLVESGRLSEKIRLHGIDAPELGQAFNERSRKYAASLAHGKQVRVVIRDRDRFGRSVGDVWLPDGKLLNREMVAAGMAWWYRRYSDDRKLKDLEKQARREGRGLWRERNPLPPWIYRRKEGTGRGKLIP